MKLFALAAGAFAAAGIAYTSIALARVRKFRNDAEHFHPRTATPISILKPLHGDEPQLFENLYSFCDQDYPEYQIVFGAADPQDPALQVARAVAARFPGRDIEIVAGCALPAANPKVGNLLGMAGRARHSIVAVADSDIRVGSTYLRSIAECFTDPGVGAATCIYGGVPGKSLASRLGAMYVNDQFAPSAMVTTAMEPLTYCFGATMAVRRDALENIGGFESLADHLGDDYVLGKRVTESGYRVALVPYAVQTTVHEPTLAALWRHELRWSRTILKQRTAGYIGSVVTYALPFAALFAASARNGPAIGALGLAAALRVALHYEARRTFAPQTSATPWLIPLRDLFGVTVWFGSFLGRTVLWKSDAYRIDAGGRMASGPSRM